MKYLLLSLCLAFAGCHPGTLIKTEDSSVSAFEIISGPDRIGISEVWIIQHKHSGARFIYSESLRGSPTMTRL